jgi:hypothetical protein
MYLQLGGVSRAGMVVGMGLAVVGLAVAAYWVAPLISRR